MNKGTQLIARHAHGLVYWNLKKTIPNFKLFGSNLANSSLVITEDGQDMWFEHEQNNLLKIDMKSSSQAVERHNFNFQMGKKQLLSSGDYLEIRNKKSVKGMLKGFMKRFSKNGLGDKEDSDDKEILNNKLILVKVNSSDRDQTDAGMFDTQKADSADNEILIFESEHKISCFSVITTLGLTNPKVLENGKLRLNPFFTKKELEGKGNGDVLEVRFGDAAGNCFYARLNFDNDGNLLSNNVEQVIDEFKSMNASRSFGGLKSPKSYRNLEKSNVTATEPEETMNDFKDKFQTAVKDIVMDGLISDRSRHLPMNDFIKFLDVDLEACIFFESGTVRTENNASSNIAQMKIFARKVGGRWAKCSFRLGNQFTISESSRFKLIKMDSFTRQDRFIRFAAYGELGVAVFEFDVIQNSLRFVRFVERIIRGKVCYSENEDSFYIPSENSVLVYDGSLEFLSYTMKTEAKVLDIYLIEGDDEKLFIYDEEYYYELDLTSLEFQKKVPLFPDGDNLEESQVPFNFQVFSYGEVFRIPDFGNKINQILFVTNTETLDLNLFPFTALLRCFDKEDYATPIIEYADYYFKKIETTNREDEFFGPLNPLLFVIYHNDMELLAHILTEYQYPKSFINYWSPLAFAFRFNYRSAVKEICTKLKERNYPIDFSREDFMYLINSSKTYCHQLVGSIPTKPTVSSMPHQIYMDSEVQLYPVQKLERLLNKLKKEEEIVENRGKLTVTKDERSMIEELGWSETPNIDGLLTSNDLEEEEKVRGLKQTKKEVSVLQIPFKFDYEAGSDDSVQLLAAYSDSSSEDFVCSEWKELVISKWGTQIWLHIGFAFIYFLFTVFMTISIVFSDSNTEFAKIVTIVLLGILISFELLQLISYSFFDILV